MRKIILLLAFVFVLSNVNALTVTQSQVDAVNFTDPAVWTGGYQFGVIQMTQQSGFWQIYTVVNYDTLTPATASTATTSTTYELVKGERTYYSEPDFALCWYLTGNAISCFEQYTLPDWTEQFLADDFFQRKYLNSLKTKGTRMLPRDLAYYFTK